MQSAMSLNHFLIQRLSIVLFAWLLVCFVALGVLGKQAVNSEYANAQILVGKLQQELIARQPLNEVDLAQIQATLAQNKAELERDEILIEIVVVAMILAAMGLSGGLVVWFGLKRQLITPLSHLVGWLNAYEEDVRKGEQSHPNMPHSHVSELQAMQNGINDLILALEAEQKRRKELVAEVLRVQEVERQTIAQDLHDHLGQMLTSISVNSATLTKRTSGALQEVAVAIQASTQDVMAWLRGSLKELKPHVLLEVSLKEAALDLTENWAKRRGWFVDFAWNDDAAKLPDELAIQVFRILQEALTNAARHSSEKRVKVVAGLVPTTNEFLLVIENNCKTAEGPISPSLGLTGITERADAVGGKLRWEQVEDVFRLSLTVPTSDQETPREHSQ